MKGFIFQEFFAMVDEAFGPDMSEALIEANDLSTGGAYTSVGDYPHSELLALVATLHSQTQISVTELVKVFGTHLAHAFAREYSHYFKAAKTTFGLVGIVQTRIHVEVRKLYPMADLPKVLVLEKGYNHRVIEYRSSHHFADLAEGLLAGVAQVYREDIEILRKDLSEKGGQQCVRFILMTKHPSPA